MGQMESYDSVKAIDCTVVKHKGEHISDFGLAPTMSTDNMFNPSTSLPPKDDFSKIMIEWNSFVGSDDNDLVANMMANTLPAESDAEQIHIKEEGFDITKYVAESESDRLMIQENEAKSSKDDEFIDVQTVSDDLEVKANVLLNSSVDGPRHGRTIAKRAPNPSIPNTPIPKPKFGGKRIDMARGKYVLDESSDDEDMTIDVETVEPTNQPVLQAGDLDSLLQEFEATESTNLQLQTYKSPQSEMILDDIVTDNPLNLAMKKENNAISLDVVVEHVKLASPMNFPPKVRELDFRNSKPKNALDKDARNQKQNKHILDDLPSALIDRIRQSSKRKPVQVIEPIPPFKKRIHAQTREERMKHGTIHYDAFNRMNKHVVNIRNVQLDHDYCLPISSKDSGCSSCEEDDCATRSKRPLMVSVLKANLMKKKLNLEEYKKRLVNRIRKYDAFPNEDNENARRLKHTEMLMKMAHERLSQQTASEKKDGSTASLPELPIATNSKQDDAQPPKNFLRKTLVSAATNTDECWRQLEQILEHAQIQITPFSLISSIAEHLPKQEALIAGTDDEHGEDKTIVFIDPAGPKKEMRAVGVQTKHSSSHLVHPQPRRRRLSSTGSTCSTNSSQSLDTSDDSMSIGLREAGRSRTPSPERRKRKEATNMADERRVVFVGRLADNTTKEDLRRRFARFGPIANVSLHFRRKMENYGFVTFLNKMHAYEAVEKGNSDPNEPEYVLCFGGRRLFCLSNYEDLDDMKDDLYDYCMQPIDPVMMDAQSLREKMATDHHHDDSFDNLLRKAQAKLRNRMI